MIFALFRPLYCLGNVKTTSHKIRIVGFSQNRRVSRVSQFRIYIRLFSFSTRRVKITACVVKTGANKAPAPRR